MKSVAGLLLGFHRQQNPSFNKLPVSKPSVSVLLRLRVCGGEQKSLSWQTGTSPARREPEPALIEAPPAQVAHSAPQLLGGELGEVCEQTQQQEDPEEQQDDAQQEDEAQRSAGRPLQGRRLVQVEAEDGHFLHKHQAAEAEDEDVLGHLVPPPQPAGPEAGRLGLVLVQQEQRLFWGRRCFALLDGGNGLVARSPRVLQQREETPTDPPQQPQHHQSRQVLEGGGGWAVGGEGEEEDEGACQGARPTPGGAQELPGREPGTQLSPLGQKSECPLCPPQRTLAQGTWKVGH